MVEHGLSLKEATPDAAGFAAFLSPENHTVLDRCGPPQPPATTHSQTRHRSSCFGAGTHEAVAGGGAYRRVQRTLEPTGGNKPTPLLPGVE